METDFSEFESKSPGDRTFMNVLYGLHTVSPFTAWSLAVLALILNYVRRSGEPDAIYVTHHNYMIATFWWTVLWLALTAPLWFLFVFPGWIAWSIVGIWYIYRCIRGWLRFNDGRTPY
jgi:uncharacterized membrane protein